MQAVARTTGVHISPRKVRLVADAVRGLSVDQALRVLEATNKHGASIMRKTLQSAIANYEQKGEKNAQLVIATLEVDGGSILRRMHIGSRSHVRMYTKRSTHIKIVLQDKAELKREKQIKKEKLQELEKKGNTNGTKS